jgi:hypothetical protein
VQNHREADLLQYPTLLVMETDSTVSQSPGRVPFYQQRLHDKQAKGKWLWGAHENWLVTGGGDNIGDQAAIIDWYEVVELEDASWAAKEELFYAAEEHAAMDQFRRYNVGCKEGDNKGSAPGIP